MFVLILMTQPAKMPCFTFAHDPSFTLNDVVFPNDNQTLKSLIENQQVCLSLNYKLCILMLSL